MRIYRFDEIDSTNDYLKTMKELEEGDVVITKIQHSGRGRRGNKWIAKEGAGLFSFVLKEDKELDENEYMKLSLVVGYSLFKSLKKIESLNYKFKWINDIYLNEKKLSGILIEKIDEYYIIGIGININNEIDETLKEIAISLSETTGKIYEIEKIILDVVKDFFEEFKKFKNGNWLKILQFLNENNYLFGKRVEISYGDVRERGVVGEILENGELEIFQKDEIKNYNIGEIHILTRD